MSSGISESNGGASSEHPRHFSRRAELEHGDRIYVWRDIWPEEHGDADCPAPITVWILESPLGMGKYGVRTDRVQPGEEITDIDGSEHIAAAGSEDEAKQIAIDWMAEKC
ncbi:hypothetical protein [Halorhabdus rudnickae]|uniref:hypothetical protein n=1 Tax=Halorhabdus rudnickae TaxID=1775544 RepID=UPI001082D499|nr:hypothetical protein [Halorhabdus rudnickae]